MTRAEAFVTLINKLAERAPEILTFNDQRLPNDKRAFECQIILASGAVMAGALTRTSIEGMYALRTPVRRGDPRTGKIDIVDQFFTAEDLTSLTVPLENSNRSGLVGPGGAEVVPVSTDL